MSRKETTIYIEEDLLHAAKALAARTGKKEHEIFEEDLKSYLSFDVVDQVHDRIIREGTALGEEESLKLAYDELHAMRREKAARQGTSKEA